MDKCYIDLIYPLGTIVLMILCYIVILRALGIPSFQDPLVVGRRFLNYWTLTHFIAFAIIGYYYPNCLEAAMVHGLVWEAFEYTAGWGVPLFFPKWADKIDPTWSLWYYGRYEDIIMNFLGFVFGRHLRLWLNPPHPVPE